MTLALEGPAQGVIALLADAEDLDRLALAGEGVRVVAREAHDCGIEGAAQSALAGADDQQVNQVRAAADQKARALAIGRGAGQIGQHRFNLFGIRAGRFDRGLRAAQL